MNPALLALREAEVGDWPAAVQLADTLVFPRLNVDSQDQLTQAASRVPRVMRSASRTAAASGDVQMNVTDGADAAREPASRPSGVRVPRWRSGSNPETSPMPYGSLPWAEVASMHPWGSPVTVGTADPVVSSGPARSGALNAAPGQQD